MPDLSIGLMSGTSLDGVDGVLADFDATPLRVLAHATAGFDPALRAELLALNTPGGHDELHRAQLAANALVRVYAQVVHELLRQAGVAASQVRAIGAHGQTVRHRPQLFDGTGYTVQLNQPALLAELTGIDVVADFRTRDVAAGGQGAPLAPFFHRGMFGRPGRVVGVLNIGGISNLTVLRPDGSQIGFDCGPGNALLDAWTQRHTGRPYDDRGAWAAGGQVDAALLQDLLAESYFAAPPPKSTGRDLFHPDWLAARLAPHAGLAPQAVQATLAELTARCCADDVGRYQPGLPDLVVCGGGALNDHLLARLRALLPGTRVVSSAEAGLPPLQVEAAAFAWLARQCVQREPLALESTTGARGARVLGAVWPA
ncbi:MULTISPECIES: anhydro-N-acetylmuramic acid kinase [Ramlibacter]|uniref:Anhydro-N-acetylmuramic acid kinase n=1 Tax=Ramlibacter pinisoli TaxID=2682844 RepID=A0A6N8J048_9BURK|nr:MULTISPECIES: anhydro-N-acetylmuramic acid kinase [Ramlibacter]MBA2962672.1 anhydro-N-acetylmuramic acid kinase [Ramlibacter sp. CGMCC 1.13660]MVQ32614.1 anhydro-N-acetylmuramic acid kinase [Ramlibacter pinisoli]